MVCAESSDNLKYKNSRLKTVISFIFPLFPIKIFRSKKLMFLIALLISLKLVLSMLAIRVPMFNLSIALSWVPVMLFGWHFGMIYGLLFGTLTDTLSFFIFPSGALWFWMYAIQEPCVCFAAGLIGSIYRLRQNSSTKNHYGDVVAFQIILVGFVSTCYFVLTTLTWHNTKEDIKEYVFFHNLSKQVALGVLIGFFIVCEIFFWIRITRNRTMHWHNNLYFIYSTMLVIILISLFSFALGPFISVEYLKYKNHREPNNFIIYGYVFYLIPRFIEQSIKVPLESIVLASGVVLCQKYIQQSIMHSVYQWNV